MAKTKPRKRGESAKAAYTLEVIQASRRVWTGRGCRPVGILAALGLGLVVSGQGQIQAGQCNAALKPGDLVWLARGDHVDVVDSHSNSGAGQLEVMLVYLELQSTSRGNEAGQVTSVRRLSRALFNRVRTMFEVLLQLTGKEETLVDKVLIWANATRLIGLATQTPRQGRATYAGPADETLRHVLGIIESRLSGALDLPVLAAAAGLTRTYFAQWFRKQVGQSPMRYVRERRVERAKALLASTDLTVEQVASQVGFDDAAHFNRVFKSVVGEPPLRHARAARG